MVGAARTGVNHRLSGAQGRNRVAAKTPRQPKEQTVSPTPSVRASLFSAVVAAPARLAPAAAATLIATATLALVGPPTEVIAAVAAQDEIWRDVDGNPLPFQDAAAVSEFLRTADVVDNDKIDIGITGPRRLVLEQDGVRAYAAFRAVDEEHTRVRMPDGSYYQKLRDFSGFEVAAYEISKLLGMDNVPPAVHRRLNRDRGTAQIWVNDTMMEQDRVKQGLRSPDFVGWRRQTQEMTVFDELIGNIDRNPGNLLIDKDWKVWLIDHTRGFQQGDELRAPEKIIWVRTAFWEALQALDRDTVTEKTGDVLDGPVINDIFKRRDQLVAHIEALIQERGSEAVLY